MGEIEEILIKGIDVEMIVVYKYSLIFIAILDKEFFKHDIRNEAEKALDLFYTLYRSEIGNNDIEISQFEPFKNILTNQIEDFFKKIKESDKKSEIGDFGFFTEAIKKLRSDPT